MKFMKYLILIVLVLTCQDILNETFHEQQLQIAHIKGELNGWNIVVKHIENDDEMMSNYINQVVKNISLKDENKILKQLLNNATNNVTK